MLKKIKRLMQIKEEQILIEREKIKILKSILKEIKRK
jgi:hypothetical protein